MNKIDPEEGPLEDRARLVVIGAGIVGCSVVWHLARMGWRDLVVIDAGPLFQTGGSTSHAPGLVFQTNYAKMMTNLAQYTVEFYSQLELRRQACFFPVGSLEVAATPERWQDLKRKLGAARSWGVSAELVDASEARRRLPFLDESRIHGAYWVEDDGIAKPVRACEAMAEQVGDRASFHGRTSVTGFDMVSGRLQAVDTTRGRIRTEQVLICAGIWGPVIGRLAGVPIPLMPVQHLYALTEPLPELVAQTEEVGHPILRHQDAAMYFRQRENHYGIGSYRHEPLPVDAHDIRSHQDSDDEPAVLPFTEKHFEFARREAGNLLPPLRGVSLTYRINGMFSFTPDGMPLIGPSNEARGVWVAEAVWITHAGGVGRAVAEWMDGGAPATDLREADLNRFAPHALTQSYVRARAVQQYREVYDVIHPLQQMEAPRLIRVSPVHARLEALGGVFFETAGWERPQWFETNEALPRGEISRPDWAGRQWSPIQASEHLAARRHAALFDLSAFAKIEVSGSGALAFLEHLCANRIDRTVGRVVYTAMLNERGGIVCDLTVTRLAADRFLVLTGAGMAMHDLAWIRHHAPDDGSVHIADVSAGTCSTGLWGPRARDLLSRVCADDLTNRAFPYYTAQRITIDLVPVLALRLSYIGELGWELYAPAEQALRLWDTLWEAGGDLGVFALGGGAFDSLRLEKGYRLWGADIHSEFTPFEAGLSRSVKLDKGEFVGRRALCESRGAGVERQLCCFTFDDPASVALGKEPIFERGSNRVLGYVTSANCGYHVGEFICYGYVPTEFAFEGSAVDVEYFGERYPATGRAEPRFDADRKRLTS